jgi:hypothetical protein
MTPQERLDYIINNKEHILRNMALHEEEKKNRKLLNFLEDKDTTCSTSITAGIYRKIVSFWTKN